jgi:hypothetical protein
LDRLLLSSSALTLNPSPIAADGWERDLKKSLFPFSHREKGLGDEGYPKLRLM